jgi:hypothetical protein
MQSSCVPRSATLPTPRSSHVFLSHNWGIDGHNHDRVSRINGALCRRGFTTWFDKDVLAGDIRQKIAEGIEFTQCFLAFITEQYQAKVNCGKRSDNCYYEFDFAIRQLPEKIIPVVMEKSMLKNDQWSGRIKAELGGNLYVDMTEDEDEIFEKSIDNLVEIIKRLTQ